jgi:cellulose synthase/poly-beta-1,6-N-acetylglucosamine synthase-like glycosyltransferase
VNEILLRFEELILVYFIIVNGFYGVQLVTAAAMLYVHNARTWHESGWRIFGSDVAPTISILAPAYNEERSIVDSVRALLALYYQNLEIIVVNDGSRDGTLAALAEAFDLVSIYPIYRRRIEHAEVIGLYRSASYPNLIVADKKNGGKADALNAALNLANGDLVCAIDADTIIERDALRRLVRPFIRANNVLAAGGTIRIANGSEIMDGRVVRARVARNPLAGFQTIEYLRAFLFGRLAWNLLGGNLIISGAFGLFRRDAVIDAGGYLHETVGEDMELVVRLRRRGYETKTATRVDFIPDPVAWTEAPETLRVLGRQRDRWHRGLAETLVTHRRLFFNLRYGAMGLVVYPYFVIVELLAPVVEALGIIAVLLGLFHAKLHLDFTIAFFALAYGLGIVFSMGTLVLEEVEYHVYASARDRTLLFVWMCLENFGYRQFTVFWRLRGILRFLMGRKDWGSMERKGFLRPPSKAAADSGSGNRSAPGSS